VLAQAPECDAATENRRGIPMPICTIRFWFFWHLKDHALKPIHTPPSDGRWRFHPRSRTRDCRIPWAAQRWNFPWN